MSGLIGNGSYAQENATIVTIASGIATIQQGGVILAAESSTSDDLDRIVLGSNFTGLGSYGVFLMLTADTGDTITLKNGTYIKLAAGADFALTGTRHVWGWHDGTNFYDLTAAINAASGTVTSVALTMPTAIFDVAGSPITTSGTFAVTLDNQTANTVFAGATSGGAATPAFRALVAADIPTTLILVRINDTNGNEQILFVTTASAVNEITITNAATAGAPKIAATGGDTDIDLNLVAKGTGHLEVDTQVIIDGDSDRVQLRVQANGTQSNHLATFENSGGTIQASISFGGGAVFNEQGNDSDFRIESDTNANIFVVDASADAIGIGTATPSNKTILDVSSTTRASRPFPTMDSTQRDAIASPATGSVIYNSTTTQFEWYNGAAWVAISGSGAVPYGLKTGLALTKETAAILNVGLGSIEVNGTVVNKTAKTRLTMSTNGDWIGGTSLEAASTYVCTYTDASGNIKFYNALPNYPRPDTASRVANARVNQAGWNGTAGNGLNATSIVYDGDTGEGSIAAGMYLGIYSDSAFTTGRGRGSGASASVNNASFALITAINTGTNTLTVTAGHNIAINDDDYLIVIEPGALEYLNVSGTWYRFIARMYNNASSDLDDARLTKRAGYVFNEASNYTVSGTSFASVDSTLGKMDIFTSGGDVRAEFNGSILSGSNYMYVSFSIDGLAVADDGTFVTFNSDIGLAQGIKVTKQLGVLPGTHSADLQAKVIAGSMTIYAGAGTANLDIHPEMWVSEVQVQ